MLPRVALRAVRDEDLIGGNIQPVRAIIVLGDRLAQELVSLLGPIAVKADAAAHFVHRLVQRLAARSGHRLRHIADAATDEPLGGPRDSPCRKRSPGGRSPGRDIRRGA